MTIIETPAQIGPFGVRSARLVYDNPWIGVVHHEVTRPDGGDGEYGVVRFKNRAVGVLPIADDGTTYLVGQHRFPFDRYSWELPEGGGPLNEDPLATAQRELAEETGLIAADWLPLVSFDVSNSVTDEEAVCFLAFGLSEGQAAPEPTEKLQVRKIAFAALLAEVLDGSIRDSLTIAMALAAHVRALNGGLPERICRLLGTGRLTMKDRP